MINLFFGFATEPREGDWTLFRQFLIEAICGNEPDPEAAADELLMLLAWKAQNFDQPPGRALVLHGGSGVGKDFFVNILADMFGESYTFFTAQTEHMFGRFNSHLENKAIIHLNGVPDEAVLKSQIADSTIMIERKFGAPSIRKNIAMFILTEYANWVVPAQLDPRILVYDVANAWQRDHTRFGLLAEQMDRGGRAALLYHLLNMDLEGWHPRSINK